MFGGPSSIVPEVGKGLADVHKHALVSTQIEGCRRRNLVVVLRGSQHIVGWIMDPSSNRVAFYYKAMRRPCQDLRIACDAEGLDRAGQGIDLLIVLQLPFPFSL